MREKNIKKPTTSARKKSAWLVSESLESLSMSRFLFEENDNKTSSSNDDEEKETTVDGSGNGSTFAVDEETPTKVADPPTVLSRLSHTDEPGRDVSGPVTKITNPSGTSAQTSTNQDAQNSTGATANASKKTVVDDSDKTVPSVLQKSFLALLKALGTITDSREIRGKSLNEITGNINAAAGASPFDDRQFDKSGDQSESAKKLHGIVTNIAKYVKTLTADEEEDTEEFYMAAVWLLSFVSLLDQVSAAAQNRPEGDSDKTLEDILGGYGGVKRLVDKNFKPNRQVQDFLVKNESQRRDFEVLLSEADFLKKVWRPIQRWLNSSSQGKKMKAMFEPNGKVMVGIYDALADMTPENFNDFDAEIKKLKSSVTVPMAKFLQNLKSKSSTASPAEAPTSIRGAGTPTAVSGGETQQRQTSANLSTEPGQQPTQANSGAEPQRPLAKKLSDVLGLQGEQNKDKRKKVLDRLKNVDISVTGIGNDLNSEEKNRLKNEIDKYEKELRDKLGREFTAESQRAKSNDSLIIERWQRLAGIIK